MFHNNWHRLVPIENSTQFTTTSIYLIWSHMKKKKKKKKWVFTTMKVERENFNLRS